MKSKLNFPHTCPNIDRAIKSAESDINNILSNLIDELAPDIDSNEIRDQYFQKIRDAITPYFEEVRDLNEKMREAAEDQIRELTATIENLEEKISGLEFVEYWNIE